MRKRPQITNPVFTEAEIPSDNLLAVMRFTIFDFLDWWFVQMPVIYIKMLRRVSMVLSDQLSISVLIKTFFVPWHRDNSFVGYFIGMTMRIIYIPIALFIYLGTLTVSTLGVFIWISLPMIALIMIVLTPLIR